MTSTSPNSAETEAKSMNDSSNHLKYLDFIQGVIGRLSSNSSSLKTWTVTLVAGLFALAVNDPKAEFLLIAYLPALTFWALDAYYLAQERAYRALYDSVRAQEVAAEDQFSLDASKFMTGKSWPRALFRRTTFGFYSPILLTILIVSAAAS